MRRNNIIVTAYQIDCDESKTENLEALAEQLQDLTIVIKSSYNSIYVIASNDVLDRSKLWNMAYRAFDDMFVYFKITKIDSIGPFKR